MTAPHERTPDVIPCPDAAAAIPVLRSDRLTLRAPTLDDFPLLVEIDGSVAEQSLRGTRSREDSWFEFTQMTATWIC